MINYQPGFCVAKLLTDISDAGIGNNKFLAVIFDPAKDPYEKAVPALALISVAKLFMVETQIPQRIRSGFLSAS